MFDRQTVNLEVPAILEERLEKLKELFPEAFIEGKVDFDKLKIALGEVVDSRPERYSFSWAGKRESVSILQTPSYATLIPVKDESVDFDTTQNIFVEGDNLEVLKLLYKPYFGKVKMIYIDPPYNTGNDFVYPDNYADPLDTYLKITGQKDANGNLLTSNPEKNGRYHSAWLSMMYPRMFLARQLLKDDGVIFISIDDNEVHNLRLLMDQIFGEENLFQQIIWQRHAGGGNDSRYFAVDHEYILAYAKNKDSIDRLRMPLSEEDKAEYNLKDENYDKFGPHKTKLLRSMRPQSPRPNLRYNIMLPDGTEIFDEWKWEESTFLEAKAQKKIVFKQDREGKWHVEYKMYLYDSNNSDDENGERQRVPRSLLTKIERNSDGKKQLSDLFGIDNLINNPKPVGLIKYFLTFATESDSIIVDFFAGSCTTAQAVLELNREDKGNRRFIMVQLPEPVPKDSAAYSSGYRTIAEIGKERIRRVIANMKKEKESELKIGNGLEDLGFKVFKLEKSSIRQWIPKKFDSHEDYMKELEKFIDPILEGWKPENVIYETAIKEGYGLNLKIEFVPKITDNKVYKVTDPDKDQSFHICLDEKIESFIPEQLGLKRDNLFICRNKAMDDTIIANIALQCRLKTI